MAELERLERETELLSAEIAEDDDRILSRVQQQVCVLLVYDNYSYSLSALNVY